MNHFQLRVRHKDKAYRAAMHVLAVLFPVWGVFVPVTLALFVLLLLRLPANLHWLYALEIILGLTGTTAVCAFFALICDDDCLRITQEGIQFPLRFAAPLRGRLFRPWDEFAVLKLRWSGSINFVPDDFLGLVFNDGTAVRMNLLHFDRDELQQLFGAIKNCGKHCEFDPELALLARANLLSARADAPPRANIEPIYGEFALKYGVQSAVARWFSEYWTPLDRLLAPWALVMLLGAFLAWGPQLLLWLAGFLPLAQLGNSGASLLAHNALVASAAAASLWAAIVLMSPLMKPTQLIVSPNGIQKVWEKGIVCLSGRLLPWNEIIAVYVLSRGRIDDNCRIVFATSRDSRAASINNAQIPDEESRKLLAEAIRSLSGSASLAPDVFDVLVPCRTLSLADIWDIAMVTSSTNPESLPESGAEKELLPAPAES